MPSPEEIGFDLKKYIGNYIDDKVRKPIFHLIDCDPLGLLRWSNVFVMIRLSESLIVERDKKRLSKSPNEDGERILEKNLYLGYLNKLLTSSLVLIGATDYVGALIIMRSVFELLIGISTPATDGMKKRIWDIEYLSESEKKTLYKLWNDLNPWTHPYRKWIKEICPKFYSCGQNYHPRLFELCIGLLENIVDFSLTATVELFHLLPSSFQLRYSQITSNVDPCQISNLKMFGNRMLRKDEE